jgi:hypothetical protein
MEVQFDGNHKHFQCQSPNTMYKEKKMKDKHI